MTIHLSELDTDKIKQSFIDWLQTQPVFKDYVYTGSNINVLLELLAKNGNMNAFMLNMVAHEAFLETAQLRDSVVTKAKELNYIPRSWRSAEALLNIDIRSTNSSPTTVTIPAGTAFNSRIDDQIFTFTTAEAISVAPTTYISASNTYVYSFTNVPVYEGEIVTETFLVDNSIENQKFVLSNKQADTSSIQVTVKESLVAPTSVAYTRADTLLGVDKESQVYFVQATNGDQYEIEFGDGVLGVKPVTGSIVTVKYRVTAGPLANDASLFQLVSPNIGGYTDYTIETADIARGGSEEESIDSIKFNAPRHYQTQEAAIAEHSYATIIRRQFPEIRAINVYGGEDMTPPRFGYVLISVDLQNFDGVPTAKKAAIESFIRSKMPPMIRPEVIDPDFTYIAIDADVEYSLSLTTNSVEDIRTIVTDAIRDYNDSDLENFNVVFRYATLGKIVSEADISITSTDVTVRIYKLLRPTIGETFSQTLLFQNAIEPSSVSSSTFTYNDITAQIIDKGDGKLYVATPDTGIQLGTSIGTVEYETGTMKISGLVVSDFVGESINLYATTTKQDVRAAQNTILAVGMGEVNINVTPVRS